jgi:hypothetical protein
VSTDAAPPLPTEAKQKRKRRKQRPPWPVVTIASLLSDELPLVLHHADDARLSPYPVVCVFIAGKQPGSEAPALTHGVPLWIWEDWLEEHQNAPVVRDRQIHAIGYSAPERLQPDMLTIGERIKEITGVAPSSTLLRKLRDALVFLATHIKPPARVPLRTEKEDSLENLRAALVTLQHECRQMTRPAILADTRASGRMVHINAGRMFAHLDGAIQTLGDLAAVEEFYATLPPNQGGVEPVKNPFLLSAVNTCGELAVEMFRQVTGALPGKQNEAIIALCQVLWAGAGGTGTQDWVRARTLAIRNQRADLKRRDGRTDRSAWVRDRLRGD